MFTGGALYKLRRTHKRAVVAMVVAVAAVVVARVEATAATTATPTPLIASAPRVPEVFVVRIGICGQPDASGRSRAVDRNI